MNLDNLFGKTRRWKEGDLLWAENDFARACYVVTDDPAKEGTEGWHPTDEPDNPIWVQFVSPEFATIWPDA